MIIIIILLMMISAYNSDGTFMTVMDINRHNRWIIMITD